MNEFETAKYRLESLNLAYGILLQQHASRTPGLTNQAPSTDSVVAEAQKLFEYMTRS